MTQPRAILDQLTAAIVATGAAQARDQQLLPANYRYPIQDQPTGGGHRRFALELHGGRDGHQMTGDGDAAMVLDLVVRVAYARLGGTAGGGDRIASNEAAGADVALLCDCLLAESNWSRATTGIREIRFVGAGRSIDGPQSEVWDSRFGVEMVYPAPS